MAETVIGVFEDHNNAEQGIHDLKQAGFRDDQVGFVVRHRGEEKMETREGRGVVAGGIFYGLLGAGGVVVTPIIGRADAANVWSTDVPLPETLFGPYTRARSNKT